MTNPPARGTLPAVLRLAVKHPHTRIAPALALLILVTVLLPSLTRSVLCVGTDGHASIETAVDGQCAPETVTHRRSITLAAAGHDCCGPCRDTPFMHAGSQATMRSGAQKQRIDTAQMPLQVLTAHAPVFLAGVLAQHHNAPSDAPTGDPARARFADVILLT